MKRLKEYYSTHKHILFLLYIPIYFIWFFSLEKWTDRDFNILHCRLDDLTPLLDGFIIPYYLWFPFVAFFCIYFYHKMSVKECVQLFSSLVIGMTITLIIYTVWPNAVSLRPAELENDGIFSIWVAELYKIDTVTNVCPSLHVLNTLIIDVAFFRAEKFKGHKILRAFVALLSFSICISTVFLKQHSYIDVACAFLLCALVSFIVYVPDWVTIYKKHSVKYIKETA
jgi:membrane-associated phospholipid phosphatase